MTGQYRAQVSLLVRTIPHVAKAACFALKGGTAINLFDRDMPRLSVDLDLAYLGFEDRETARRKIDEALATIAPSLKAMRLEATLQGNGHEKKLIVSDGPASVKVEPNYTLRGHVFAPVLKGVCATAESDFGYAEMLVLSRPELYGGKLCAALDRQHPRDLFDVSLLLADPDDGDLMKGFVAMLLSHNRPAHELLAPIRKDQSATFRREFSGMTELPFAYEDHERTFDALLSFIRKRIGPYRDLLMAFFSLSTDLPEAGIPNFGALPAIQWKRRNLETLRTANPAKFAEQTDLLREVLEYR